MYLLAARIQFGWSAARIAPGVHTLRYNEML